MGFGAETPELLRQIDRVFTKYPFFGSRQIAADFPRKGIIIERLWRFLRQAAAYLHELADGFVA
ncbi:MAG: hypothetical protein COB08_019005 [Rhodobacteraceae bacterium]|nr:hypothetical protein [Paracoccaceae bacterium]